MFKFRSYNVKKATDENEKKQPSSASKTPSYSTMTLKKPPRKEKKKASPNEITVVANKESPEYKRCTSTSVKKWETNKTYSPKSKKEKEKEKEKEENKNVNLHKKLERISKPQTNT